jgi:hypothetical protein
MKRPQGSGLLSSNNMLMSPCNDINRSVPFFKEHERDYKKKNESIYQYVFNKMDQIFMNELDLADKNSFIPGLEDVPDGSVFVKEASDKKLNVKLSINDSKYFQYHRNNGISKIGVIDPAGTLIDSGKTTYLLRPVEGVMNLQDKIN